MIVSCIVNTKTGEIVESVESNKDKLTLRLKCRDYYNKQQENDKLFRCVEFSTQYSYSYATKAMQDNGLTVDQLSTLIKTYKTWLLDQLEMVQLSNAEKDLQETIDSDPGDYQWAKDEEIQNAREVVSTIKDRIYRIKSELSKM